MANKVDRLELLRVLLVQRGHWTTGELAKRLNVSHRTLFRDIYQLRMQGLDIEADRGVGGGVRLLTNWSARKIELSESQTLRILISIALMTKMGLPLFSDGKESIQTKILSGIPRHLLKRFSELKSRVFVGHNASDNIQKSYCEPSKDILELVELGFIKQTFLEIRYQDERGKVTTRLVEPQGLIVNWPAWYLMTFDHLRNDVRTFRLDRIRSARPRHEKKFRVRAQEIFDQILGSEFGDPL